MKSPLVAFALIGTGVAFLASALGGKRDRKAPTFAPAAPDLMLRDPSAPGYSERLIAEHVRIFRWNGSGWDEHLHVSGDRAASKAHAYYDAASPPYYVIQGWNEYEVNGERGYFGDFYETTNRGWHFG